MVGDYVLVRYEDDLYPGRIIEIKNDEEVLISAMKKSGDGQLSQIKSFGKSTRLLKLADGKFSKLKN